MKKQRDKKNHGPTLSAREREVLTWAAHGKTYAEISSLLAISEDTAKAHIERASVKLDTGNKTHTVAIAVSLGLVELTLKKIPRKWNSKDEFFVP